MNLVNKEAFLDFHIHHQLKNLTSLRVEISENKEDSLLAVVVEAKKENAIVL